MPHSKPSINSPTTSTVLFGAKKTMNKKQLMTQRVQRMTFRGPNAATSQPFRMVPTMEPQPIRRRVNRLAIFNRETGAGKGFEIRGTFSSSSVLGWTSQICSSLIDICTASVLQIVLPDEEIDRVSHITLLPFGIVPGNLISSWRGGYAEHSSYLTPDRDQPAIQQ